MKTLLIPAAFALLFSCFSAYAQTYPFKYYSIADGLAQSSVSCIYQDSQGRMWFGAWGGISRYDGKRFWSYSRSTLRVLSICEDARGTMWIGTTFGIAQLAPGDTAFRWTAPLGPPLPSNQIRALFRDRADNIWIGTSRGLALVNAARRRLTPAGLEALGRLPVTGITEDRDGAVLVANSRGIVRCTLRDSTALLMAPVLQGSAPTAMMVSRSGDLIAAPLASRKILRRRGPSWESILTLTSLDPTMTALSLCEDTRGDIWVGTALGLVIIKRGKVIWLTRKDGLPNQFIQTLFLDREGILWAGSEEGVLKLSNSFIVNYTAASGLPADHVIAIFQDHAGNSWFGTYHGAVLLQPSGALRTFGPDDGVPHPSVHDFCEDARGDVWIGTYDGLVLYSHGNIRQSPIPALRKGPVVRLLRAPDGAIYCGMTRKILKVLPDRTVVTVCGEQEIADGNVSALFLDGDGTLWFGTDSDGAGRCRGGHIERFSERDGLPDPWVTSIARDSHGRLWFGTQRGIVVWNGERFDPCPAAEDPLRNGVVTFLVRDSSGALWCGTQQGVYVWQDSLIEHLRSNDGLAADMARRGYVDPEGGIWIGTVGGVSHVDRSILQRAVDPPPVSIEGLVLDDRPGEMLDRASYSHEENTFTIHYNAVTFVDENRIEFRYRLAGLENEWQSAHNMRQARYTHLPPGTYEFLVQGRQPRSGWSQARRFAFVIAPPVWARWWFLSAAFCLFAAAVAALVRARVRRLLEIERMRARIARDLHDEIGSNLSSIAMASELLKRQAVLGPPQQAKLSQVSSIALSTMQGMKDIVWLINPDNDSLETLLLRMKDSTGPLLGGISYTLQFPVHVNARSVSLDWKRNVFLLYKECLTNIAKHAHATAVQITVELMHDRFTLTVCDNGQGFGRAGAGGGNGLKNMEARARLLRGRFTLEQPPGAGTVVRLESRIT